MKNVIVLTESNVVLTTSELRVIQEAAQGYSSKEIAANLNLAFKTVEVHRHNVMKKTGARNFIQLIVALYKKGILK